VSGIETVVRAVVVLDLVDSTKLTERKGDAWAAEVGLRWSRAARDLLTAHHGQEIDQTDGFLLVFQRPIDACRYAIAFHEKLGAIAEDVGEPLSARAGIHLGELYTSRNDPDDVKRGAKPVAVEGLAKSLAARVANLAGAGQTLLTQSAFEIARRATIGSNDAIDVRLEWLNHGAYRLNGVTHPLDIFEVGIEGLSPLTAPADSEKAHCVTAEEVDAAAAKALPPAVALVESLESLSPVPIDRRRETLEKLFAPIHAQFLEVHKDYLELFEFMEMACPRAIGDGTWTFYRDHKEIEVRSRDEAVAALGDAKRAFAERRERLWLNRVDLRAKGGAILNAIVGQEEQRYAWGVISYLLDPKYKIGSTKKAHMDVQYITLKGGRSAIRTVSTLLLEELDSITDPDAALEAVEAYHGNVNARWEEIAALWAEANVAVWAKRKQDEDGHSPEITTS